MSTAYYRYGSVDLGEKRKNNYVVYSIDFTSCFKMSGNLILDISDI